MMILLANLRGHLAVSRRDFTRMFVNLLKLIMTMRHLLSRNTILIMMILSCLKINAKRRLISMRVERKPETVAVLAMALKLTGNQGDMIRVSVASEETLSRNTRPRRNTRRLMKIKIIICVMNLIVCVRRFMNCEGLLMRCGLK